ncbi:MAG: 16S rRNA (guanine(966)-N(2))-methyltransferase RsmD [Deltaproteobacteria bacterium]|nr:16S rRNA (guanine(966)-N(2))-methyltransferase RsmD [Deltaproteobacteria bacterium]
MNQSFSMVLMRIVAGQARGRKLIVPKGREVRPTADRVREALFSMLGSRISNARVLDLFAGTGALGLEALSRGAASAVFVEKSKSVRMILKKNITNLGFESKAGVIPGDARSTLRVLKNDAVKFDVVFLDPPYAGTLLEETLGAIGAQGLLEQEAFVIAEHPRGEKPVLPKSLRIVATKSYGGTDLSIVEHSGSSTPVT